MNIPNLIIEASAGTGKTEELAKRLMALMDAKVAPEDLVALTFSRAAAGEIFQRLVSILSRERRADLLRRVLSTQHLSQIGTLDSFLMRMVGAFPEELALKGEIEILDDYNSERERDFTSSLILRKTEATLGKQFVDAFSFALGGENVRSFVETYRAFVKSWHKLVARYERQEAWGDAEKIFADGSPVDLEADEETLRQAAAKVREICGGGKDDKEWRAFADGVEKCRGTLPDKSGYLPKILAAKDALTCDMLTFVYRKERTLTREQTKAVQAALKAMLGYVLRRKFDYARGVFVLVLAFEKAYAKRVRMTGQLVFDDVPRLIAKLDPSFRLALEYRMDARLAAWALDEFQDTSREQWKAIENLIHEAESSHGGKPIFIVGDKKQAIYGWREGDVEIFDEVAASGAYKLEPRSLTYRLCPAIVKAVNRIFVHGALSSKIPSWRADEHESAKPELTGFVRTMTATGRTEEDYLDFVEQALKVRPRRGTTAILVRDNDFGEFLADRLKARGVKDVVWEGRKAILDTIALSGFLDLLQLADHPGDKLTYHHFLLTPLAKAKYPNGVPEASQVSAEMSTMLTSKGLVRTLRALRALLPAEPTEAWSVFTEERYTDMLHAAADYERTLSSSSRFADFSRYLASRKKRLIAESGKIRIITIHRSKGLGFDYVILPLLEKKALTVAAKGPLIGPDWVLPDISDSLARQIPELRAASEKRQARVTQEALCLMYVAMTRAKRGLTIIRRPPNATAKSGGETVYFSDVVGSVDLSDLEHPAVDLNAEESAAETPVEEAKASVEPAPRAPRSVLKRRLPSLQFHTGMSAGALFASVDKRRAAIARGTAAHKAMEAVEFTSELPKPEGFVELWRERAFEVRVGDEWISGRFDRVTFFNTSEGLAAEIVDFKSSLAHPERYESQLAAYRRALAILTSVPESRITTRLVQL